jgi:hypothetical protein
MAHKMETSLIITWNANGILGKKDEVESFLKTHDVDVLTVCETKLLKTDKLQIRNYNIIRNDRDGTSRGGGVAIIVKNGIPHIKVRLPDTEFETVAIRLVNNNIFVIAIYNRPANKFNVTSLRKLSNLANKLIIGGDLNAKHDDWGNSFANKNGRTLKNFLDDRQDITLNYPIAHTHFPSNNTTPSTIDLFLHKNINNYTRATALQELNSDHNPVQIKIDKIPPEDVTKTVISYKNTNWGNFRKTLDRKIKINNNINSIAELDTEIKKYTKAIEESRKAHSQTIKINTQKIQLPETITNLIKNRNKLRKTQQRTGQQALATQLKTLNNNIKHQIADYKNNKWNETLQKATTRDNSIWKLAKTFSKRRQKIPPLTTTDIEAVTDAQKAEVLAQHFHKIHKNDDTQNTNEQNDIQTRIAELLKAKQKLDTQYYDQNITNPEELLQIIKKLPNNKSPGEDRIDNKIIKNLSQKATVQLTYITNAIIKLNYFPTKFKTALIIPILKPNKRSDKIESYRPISLLNSISKIIEKIIHRRFNKKLNKLKINKKCQFGFKKAHNTTQQIARIVNDITINFNKDKATVMTLLDLEKAFDRVWIDGLIYKMHQDKFNVNFIKLIASYLKDRQLKVKINNTVSTEKSIESGVPQGSILGPALFNYYINDLPEFEKTETALYADDTAIYAHSFYAQAAATQNQIHINQILKYFQKWKLKLNENKTETITFARKRTNIKIFSQLKINNEKITPKKTVKYLGLHLDARLNFKHHIQQAINKGNVIIRKIYPLIVKGNKMTTENKILLYKTLIRPTITYAAPVWSHLSNYALEPLEVFQNKCLRLANNASRYTNTEHLRTISKIKPIKEFIADMSKKFYKRGDNQYINKILEIHNNNIPFGRIKHRLVHQHLDIFKNKVPKNEQ